MKVQSLFCLILLIATCLSCSVKNTRPSGGGNSSSVNKRTSYVIQGPSNAVAYVERYKRIAVKESIRTRIPASIKLAQGILESAYGKSVLAKKANNHFGIKCGGKQWKGKKHHRKGSCYRVFKSGDDAYVEHSKFLTYNKRYSHLFKLKTTNYKGWAYGLKKAGYAESRTYPQKLIELIQRYKLYKYDA